MGGVSGLAFDRSIHWTLLPAGVLLTVAIIWMEATRPRGPFETDDRMELIDLSLIWLGTEVLLGGVVVVLVGTGLLVLNASRAPSPKRSITLSLVLVGLYMAVILVILTVLVPAAGIGGVWPVAAMILLTWATFSLAIVHSVRSWRAR